MVTVASISPSLGKDTWFAALNMEDAYFHVDVHPSHRRFLRFLKCYQCRVLTFSLATASRVFTKVVLLYLDDWLLTGRSCPVVLSATFSLLCLLASLGICINIEKSTLIPTQIIAFIGTTLEPITARAYLLVDRCHTKSSLINQVTVRSQTTVWVCLSL